MDTQAQIQYCQAIAKSALKDMANVATDKRFQRGFKEQELARVRAGAISKIEAARADYKADSEKLRSELEIKARYSATPNEDQAAQLMYTKAALEAHWKTMNATQLNRDFEAAIAGKDLIAMKVYRDFSAPVWNEKNGLPAAIPSEAWQRLAESAEKLLLPPDVLKAQKQLSEMDQQNTDFLIGSRTAMNELQQAILGGDGESIVTESGAMAMVKNSF